MAYRRSKGNIRRPVRRRRTYRRRSVRAPRRRTYVRRMNPVCNCPKEMGPGDKFVLTQSDPFDPRYFGSKIPDSATIPSISTPIQYNLALTSDVAASPNFAHAWAFFPNLYRASYRAIGTSVNQFSWSPAAAQVTDAPQAAGFSQQFEAYRPTAHAIRISCPFAPTTTTGFVHIAIAVETTFPSANVTGSAVSSLAPDIASMSNYTFYKRVTLASLTQSPITLINKWTDETAFRYQSPNSYNSDNAGSGGYNTFHIPNSWGILMVAVEGVSTVTTIGQTITPLQAEVVLQTENIPNRTGTLIGSVAAPYSPSELSTVSQAVANTDFAHTEEQQEAHQRSFAQAVSDATGITQADLWTGARRIAGTAIRHAVGMYMRRRRPGLPGVNAEPNRLLVQ